MEQLPFKDAMAGYFSRIGRKGGKIGGKRSLETMTPQERTARAKKAAAKSAEVRKKASRKMKVMRLDRLWTSKRCQQPQQPASAPP